MAGIINPTFGSAEAASHPEAIPTPPGLLGGAGFDGLTRARTAAHAFAVQQFESRGTPSARDDATLRCYEQLSLVFEMTEHLTQLRSPEDIEIALLRRSALALRADAVLRRRGGDFEAVEPPFPGGAWLPAPSALRRVAGGEPPAGGGRSARILPGESPDFASSALIAPWSRDGESAGAVAYLRRPGRTGFDEVDAEACETILAYGAQIIRNVGWVNQVRHASGDAICALVRAIDDKDSYTLGHSERVGVLARLMGRALGMGDEELCLLEWAGLLHDVGKIAIPESILNKPGKLTPEELAIVRRHPQASCDVLRGVRPLEPILPAVLHHHENHDGSGYPDGLAGAAIPLPARILHVVDVFDALTSNRAYRSGYSVARALGILIDHAGSVTDPLLTRVFIEVFKRYVAEFPDDFARRFRPAS